MTETELIHALKASSRRAFDEIYRLYAGRLYAFCLQYCKVREDAEEIVEDVFVNCGQAGVQSVRNNRSNRCFSLFPTTSSSTPTAARLTLPNM